MALKKNAGFQVVDLLRKLTSDTVKSLSLPNKFAFTFSINNLQNIHVDNIKQTVHELKTFSLQDIVLNGKESLEDAFADIKHQEVIRKKLEAKKDETKIPRNVILLIRQKETMRKLLYLMAS